MGTLQNHLGYTGLEGPQEVCIPLLGVSLLPRKVHLDEGFVGLEMPETIQSETRTMVWLVRSLKKENEYLPGARYSLKSNDIRQGALHTSNVWMKQTHPLLRPLRETLNCPPPLAKWILGHLHGRPLRYCWYLSWTFCSI